MFSCLFSRDASMIAAGFQNSLVKVWDSVDYNIVANLNTGSSSIVSSLFFSNDNKILFAAE